MDFFLIWGEQNDHFGTPKPTTFFGAAEGTNFNDACKTYFSDDTRYNPKFNKYQSYTLVEEPTRRSQEWWKRNAIA